MMMYAQFGIMFFGIIAIWLTQEKDENRRRWASVFGLLSQPFWLYTSYATSQWGVFFISFIYALIWAKGFYYNWIKKKVE